MRSELADALKANVALQKANTALQTELDSLKAAQCGAPEPWRERVVYDGQVGARRRVRV